MKLVFIFENKIERFQLIWLLLCVKFITSVKTSCYDLSSMSIVVHLSTTYVTVFAVRQTDAVLLQSIFKHINAIKWRYSKF